MSYLKYANLCAEVVRASLKEPFLTKASGECAAHSPCAHPSQAKSRESVYFRSTPFESGKPGKSGEYASEDGFSCRTLGFSSAHAGAALTLSSVITEVSAHK